MDLYTAEIAHKDFDCDDVLSEGAYGSWAEMSCESFEWRWSDSPGFACYCYC